MTDFGIATGLTGADETTTPSSSVYGSVAYMSPEQVDGQVDYRSDLYSLGITLYELLTGQVPFTGRTWEVIVKHSFEAPQSPKKLREDIADQLVISEATVRTHVSNILSKLHLASRTQAALYALREGLASLDTDVPFAE